MHRGLGIVKFAVCASWGILVLQAGIFTLEPAWRRLVFLPAMGFPVVAYLMFSQECKDSEAPFTSAYLTLVMCVAMAPMIVLLATMILTLGVGLLLLPFGLSGELFSFVTGEH